MKYQQFFMELDKLILNFIWKNKHARIARKIHTKKLEGKPGILEIKIYYKVFKIK